MTTLMKVEETEYVCKDLSMWKEVISAYPNGKLDIMYVWTGIKLLITYS
jgi:hypothetical protein